MAPTTVPSATVPSATVPSVVVTIAENQRSAAAQLQHLGAAEVIDLERLPELLPPAISRMQQTDALARMSHNASRLVDGMGSRRVVEFLMEKPL